MVDDYVCECCTSPVYCSQTIKKNQIPASMKSFKSSLRFMKLCAVFGKFNKEIVHLTNVHVTNICITNVMQNGVPK